MKSIVRRGGPPLHHHHRQLPEYFTQLEFLRRVHSRLNKKQRSLQVTYSQKRRNNGGARAVALFYCVQNNGNTCTVTCTWCNGIGGHCQLHHTPSSVHMLLETRASVTRAALLTADVSWATCWDAWDEENLVAMCSATPWSCRRAHLRSRAATAMRGGRPCGSGCPTPLSSCAATR